ncbi:AP-5 complex subunit zeta-1 isoform X1 [Synchiropus splendidus]|uniref:AP-5 complex subunit zeta-1 isoform X1 n=1 Tax=Synchiropus splendidus TaxID=270530 RepID=UPI00237D6CE6|nr:AP-5 complex subunit zeta-1 isoform X1 [Synchiropus splendidus]
MCSVCHGTVESHVISLRTPLGRALFTFRHRIDGLISRQMYSVGSERLIQQAREIQESELQRFYSRLVKQLQAKELGHEAVDSLQRLHLILSACKDSRMLPSDLQKRLLSLLSSPSEQIQVLTSAVLRETLPLSGQEVNYSSMNSHSAAMLLSQAASGAELSSLCSHLLSRLDGRSPDSQAPTVTHTLPILNVLLTHSPESLSEDHVTLLCKKLVDWLRYASITQGGGASTGGFFTGSRSRQPVPTAELDGSVSGDFFTVLCVGQGFTEDQWMNVYSFSMLRHWLLTFHGAASGPMAADLASWLQLSLSLSHSCAPDDRSEVDGSLVSMVSATSSSSRLLPPKERLREKTLQYCLRLIEQSDRKAQKRIDVELQKVCLVEAVCILDGVCEEDPSLVYRAFPCIKALFSRLNTDLSFARVLLPIAQFYLHHGEMAAVECESVWKLVFGRFPAELFNDPFLAHELLRFLRVNVKSLELRVPLYTRSFPNLLKFLAWDSAAVVEDFVDLLPSLVTPGTAVELLHTLLDLPCLSATLILQLRSASLAISEQGGRTFRSLDAFRNPTLRGLFLFLLRGESGSGLLSLYYHHAEESHVKSEVWLDPSVAAAVVALGFGQTAVLWGLEHMARTNLGPGGSSSARSCLAGDTIDRLSSLHSLLSEAAEWPRVLQCSQVVPPLLHIYFDAVVAVADERLLAHLLQVQLERSSLLLNVPKYIQQVHRVFSCHLLRLCKLHPSLVVDQSHELLEFGGTSANVYKKEELYTHVVWVLGEYLSASCDSRCSVSLITACFEALEAVLFEITSSSPPPGSDCPAPRVITTLMSALAKLASRSHDLIPRVSLFLSKLRSGSRASPVWCPDEEDLDAIVTLGEELWSLLKSPGVAQSVLTPPPQLSTPQWHRDINVATPLQLRALTGLTPSP